MEDLKATKQIKKEERIRFAERLLKENAIEYYIKCMKNGHFHCYKQSDGSLVQYWAGTGKIMGYDARGIHSLIKILTA